MYRVILADPPWNYRVKNRLGSANNHYETMSTNDIAALPIDDLSMRDSVLLMWFTWPMMPDALKIVDAWGFEYVTGFPWIKMKGRPVVNLWGEVDLFPAYGTGFWIRGCSEPILIARKGNPPLPEGNFLGLISERMAHSRKPENIYHLAESMPGPYLELFSRRPREGWDAFGNEIENSISMGENDE